MANGLTATSSGGSQTTTSDPQSATSQSGGPSTSSGSVQPGTTSSLLTTQNGGVPLNQTPLTTVNLSGSKQTTSTTVTKPTTHHASPVLVGCIIALFVIAILSFWLTSRSAKSTTNY